MEIRGADRYQPDKLPVLERNLEDQITGTAKYSLDVAVTVFRIYQLQPSAANKELIAKTLLKALTQLPKPDYRVLIHVLPERLVADEPVSSVVLLAQHLECSNLQDFWAASSSCRDVIAQVPGFYDAIRAYVQHSIGITFRKVSKQVLADWLRVEGASLQQLIAEKEKTAGWKVQGDVCTLPLNAYNQATKKRTRDVIEFAAVAPVIKNSIAAV